MDNGLDFNDPKVIKTWEFFQKTMLQSQMQMPQQMQNPMMAQQMPNPMMPQQMPNPMMFQQQMNPMMQQMNPMMFQQQQQMILQQQMFQQQQMFYNQYLMYCQSKGLNSADQNVYNQYCQMMNNPMGNSMNMGNMGNMGNFQQQQQGNNNYLNSNNPQMQVNNNTNPSPSTNDPNQPKEIIPRGEKTLYLKTNELQGNNMSNNFQSMGNNAIVNVTLTATSGLKVVIPAPKSMSFKELFQNYAMKASIPVNAIGKDIVFLFNAEKLNPQSTEPISTRFNSFAANVTVLDQNNIIGA